MLSERQPTGEWHNRYQPDRYRIQRLANDADAEQYLRTLEAAYEPLGFMNPRVLPSEQSDCYIASHQDRVVGIFRLTEVAEPAGPYHRWLPQEVSGGGARWLEVNNVVIAAEFRATVLLGVLLHRCACIAAERGYAAIVGITRLQTLKFFADFGVVPVDHPPLQLLGRPELKDFIIYYDTRDPDSLAYLQGRARRWFHQQYVMRCIQERCRALPPTASTLAAERPAPTLQWEPLPCLP